MIIFIDILTSFRVMEKSYLCEYLWGHLKQSFAVEDKLSLNMGDITMTEVKV